MPIIKPVSDLRNKSNELLGMLAGLQEPIFITKGGEGKAVLMSMSFFDHLNWKMDLYQKLGAAQADWDAGDRGKPLKEVIKNLKKKYLHEK